jgi:hypothetical protein
VKYQPQPALELMRCERWTVPAAARAIKVEVGHLRGTLKGLCYPSPEVRERLPILLREDLSKLFTPERLAGEYRKNNCGRPTSVSAR